MVGLLVFYIHVLALVTMFTKRWQEEGWSEAFLVVFFMGLIFFVGWSISSFLMKLVLEKEGFGVLFDRDAASLVLLTIGEMILYYFYLRDEKKQTSSTEKEINEGEN